MSENSQKVSLSEMMAGERCKVLTYHVSSVYRSRLASLGFTPGAQVTMAQNFKLGPIIVTVRGTRVALGRGEAAKILVERII